MQRFICFWHHRVLCVFRSVVSDYHPKTKPISQFGHRLTHMSAADDYDSSRGFDRFHQHLHLSTADADIAFSRITERV